MPFDRIPPSANPRAGEVYVGRAGSSPYISVAPVRVIPAACAAGVVSLGIQVLGDSTGNGTDEWVNLIALDAAAAYSAYEVRHYYWDSTNDLMPSVPTIVHAAPNGKRHVPFTAVNGQTRQFLGDPVTGDLDVRTLVEPNSWTSGACVFAASFFSGSPNRAWRFMKGGGSAALNFDWSVDGSALQATAVSSAWTPPAGSVWVRVTLDVDNGAGGHTITFYQSSDGATWTQIGLPITRAGTTSVNAAAGPYEIAGRGGGSELFSGKVYEVEIRQGINGPLVAPVLPELWDVGSSASPDPVGSPILSFVNGSHPGAGVAFLSDTARLGRMTPNYGQRVVFISTGHNESLHSDRLRQSLASCITAVKARLPGTTIVGLTQNPRTPPVGQIVGQAQRRIGYIAWAQSLGWTPVDTYQAFLDDPRGLAALVGDGMHPTAAGSRLWADVVERVLGIP